VRKENRWRLGPRALAVPPLPESLRGSSGCLLARAIFDEEVGVEVYLAILEESGWSLSLAAASPFNLFCKSGLGQTRSGSLIFLVWRIAAESKAESVHEQFLNPNNIETVRDLSALAQQTHLKALIINSQIGEVIDWFEFENDFGFDKLLLGAVQAIGQESPGEFGAAIEEFTHRYTLDDLLKT
jgi:hypothetical protein